MNIDISIAVVLAMVGQVIVLAKMYGEFHKWIGKVDTLLAEHSRRLTDLERQQDEYGRQGLIERRREKR